MKKQSLPINLKQIRTRFINCFRWIILIGLLTTGCNNVKENTVQKRNPNGRNDTWKIVGEGGGGAMFYPTVSPQNPDYAFVSCDMSQSFVTYNGGQSWRMFCLRGVVRYYVFDPIDPNTIYAKSIGLFRSTDKGNTWKIVYPDPEEITGIVQKGDEANEYLTVKDHSQREVMALAVDPADSKKLYAVISINDTITFCSSNDWGKQWTKEKNLEDRAKNIYILPSSPKADRTVYITGRNGITVRENGKWVINKGPKDVKMLTEFSGGYDQDQKKLIIYAVSGKSYFNPDGDISGIHCTTDGGKTWGNRQDGLLKYCVANSGYPEWRTIATSALHPEVVYVSYNSMKTANDTTSIGVARSEDYGKTWKLVWQDRLTKQGDIYSKNYKKGWVDERHGPTWGENPFSIGVSPANPDVCYATDFGRAIKTSNGGTTWEQLYANKKNGAGWISTGLDVTTGYSVVFDPFDKNHLFFVSTDVGLMESLDGGESWMSATKDNGVPNNWQGNTYHLTFDPEVKGRAWAVMSGVHDLPRYKMWRRVGFTGFTGGILMTDDGSKSWKVISGDIGEAAMTHILIDPLSNKDSRILYACAFGKGVYKSLDGGKTWQQKNNGIEGKEILAWSMVRREKDGVLFLLVNRRKDDGTIGTEQDGAIYKSGDGAEHWSKISLPDEANSPTSLIVDPANASRILISTWGRMPKDQSSSYIGGGIYITNDDCKTWKQVLGKDQFIHDLTYDPHYKVYYACGFNSSAYRSDDQGETWKRIKGFNHKLGRRVDVDPRNPDMIFISTYGAGVWYGLAKGDAQAIEDIITPALSY